WRMLLRQEIRLALYLARVRVGSSSAARIAMMAMTTSNSISVKARQLRPLFLEIPFMRQRRCSPSTKLLRARLLDGGQGRFGLRVASVGTREQLGGQGLFRFLDGHKLLRGDSGGLLGDLQGDHSRGIVVGAHRHKSSLH